MTDRGPMERALADALRSAPAPDRDRAAVQLARRYAQLLDDVRGQAGEAATYSEIGPKYLAALTALGLTLAGRATRGGTPDAPKAGGKRDDLRARREARAAGAG